MFANGINLQDCLVAIKNNKSLEESHRERRSNPEFYMRSIKDIEDISRDYPDAMSNTVKIAERCNFDLARDQSYIFPVYNAPEGYTPETYVEKLCQETVVSMGELIRLAFELDGSPKYLGQRPGGMIISSTPLTDIVPVQRGAI